MNDDDEENCGNIGTNRYQTTPSLQALQQMRNRLHTAYLGKRLMKWTAVATGKELRQIAEQITIHQESTFNNQYRLALIQLARCRFHNTEFYKVLTENVGHESRIRIETTHRFVAGVKVTLIGMTTDGPVYEPYSCISRGGEILAATRQTWENLVKNLVLVTRLRTSFNTVFKSNRDATKKQNVMSKIIIPKTKNTIRYILNELEESDREDFYRLKKIQKLKRKLAAPVEEKKNKVPKNSVQLKVLSPVVSVCELLETSTTEEYESVIANRSIEEYEPTCEGCKILVIDLKDYINKVIALSKSIQESSMSNELNNEDVAYVLKVCQQMKYKLNLPKSMCDNCTRKSQALVPYKPLYEPKAYLEIPRPPKEIIQLGPCTSSKDSIKTNKSQRNLEFSAEKTQSMISTNVTKLETIGSTKLRATVSWTTGPSNENPAEEFAKKLSLRLRNAKRGVLLLPAEVSNLFSNQETKNQ